MPDRVLEKPLIFTPPRDEEPTRLFFWNDVREWSQEQVVGWREFSDRVEAAPNEIRTEDTAVAPANPEVQWENIVEMADEMISGKRSGEAADQAEVVIQTVAQDVQGGNWIPATSVFGRHVRRLAETDVVAAVDRVNAGPTAEGLDDHEVRWGPYRTPPLGLLISGYGRTLNFNSWAALQAWAEKERERWNQVAPLASVEPIVGKAVVDAHVKHFDGMAKTIAGTSRTSV